jgi:hypothetical protein
LENSETERLKGVQQARRVAQVRVASRGPLGGRDPSADTGGPPPRRPRWTCGGHPCSPIPPRSVARRNAPPAPTAGWRLRPFAPIVQAPLRRRPRRPRGSALSSRVLTGRGPGNADGGRGRHPGGRAVPPALEGGGWRGALSTHVRAGRGPRNAGGGRERHRAVGRRRLRWRAAAAGVSR